VPLVSICGAVTSIGQSHKNKLAEVLRPALDGTSSKINHALACRSPGCLIIGNRGQEVRKRDESLWPTSLFCCREAAAQRGRRPSSWSTLRPSRCWSANMRTNPIEKQTSPETAKGGRSGPPSSWCYADWAGSKRRGFRHVVARRPKAPSGVSKPSMLFNPSLHLPCR